MRKTAGTRYSLNKFVPVHGPQAKFFYKLCCTVFSFARLGNATVLAPFRLATEDSSSNSFGGGRVAFEGPTCLETAVRLFNYNPLRNLSIADDWARSWLRQNQRLVRDCPTDKNLGNCILATPRYNSWLAKYLQSIVGLLVRGLSADVILPKVAANLCTAPRS